VAGTITRGGRRGSTRITNERGAVMPSFLVMQDSAGNDWYLWFDTSGNLKTAQPSVVEGASFAPNTDGTKVGAQ
jgi:hypothetical protein